MEHTPYLAVVDFGSQYTHLITRRLRELGVVARLVSPRTSAGRLKGAAGVILSGGPKSVLKNPVPYNPKLLELKVPTLGVC